MADANRWELNAAGWEIRFAADTATLECRHAGTGARLVGVVSFEHVAGDKATAWTVVPPRDGVHARLALLDTQQNVQGYLVPQPRPDRLTLTVIHRTAQSYSGRLRFEGTAILGRRTFACRTRPNPASPVVQMASGPADSALNDSLFDMDSDTLLRFSGAAVQLRTRLVAIQFKKIRFMNGIRIGQILPGTAAPVLDQFFGHFGDGQMAIVFGPEIPGTGVFFGIVPQRRAKLEIAAKGSQHMLPGPYGMRIADVNRPAST